VSPRQAARHRVGLESVLGAIARTAAGVCDASDALIHLLESDHHRLVARHGRLTRFHLVERHPVRRDTPLGLAVLTRRPVHIRDLPAVVHARFPGLVQLGLYHGKVRTMLVVPLLRNGTTLGGIVIRRLRVQPFTAKQIALLKTFADQAAIAIENARLSEELAERNRDLSDALEQQTATAEILRVISSSPTDLTPVFETIVRNAARVCEVEDATLMLLEGGDLAITAHHGEAPVTPLRFPAVPGSVAGRAVLERRPIHVEDLVHSAGFPEGQARARRGGYRSVLAVPLVREGVAIGCILTYRMIVRPFTERQTALLQTFADQAVIAIENARLFTELQARNRALSEALEQQTATAEILRAISSSPTNLEPVLDTLAKNAARVCGTPDASVLLLDGELVRLTAHYGPIASSVPHTRAVARTFASGRAILDRKPVHIHDIEGPEADDFAPYRTAAHQAGYRALLAMPMLRGETAIGVLNIRRREAGPFSERQIALLKIFSDQAVIAIENVRLFNELQARNHELTEALEQQTATAEILRVISSSPSDVGPVFDAILMAAARLCGASFGAAYRYDGRRIHFVNHYRFSEAVLELLRTFLPAEPTSEGAVGRAILGRCVVHVTDIGDPNAPPRDAAMARLLPYRSVVAVPMLREGVPVGALALSRGESPFSDRHIALLRTFADQAVIAIENARLFSELQQRTGELGRSVDQLRALSEVGQAVSSTLDLDAVLQAIVSRASQLAGTRGCSIWEYDEGAEVFQLRATTILDAEIAETLKTTGIRKGEGAIGRAALTRAPVQIPDVSAAGAYENPLREALLRAGGGSVLTIPLLHEDRLLGGLTVSRRATGEFPADFVALLTGFAAQSAIALNNARLFRELQAKSQELEIASRHKSQFLANMSHELRTPLNAILGYGELMADGIYGQVPEPMRDVLGRVDASGRHLLGLINDVLDLSKIEAGQLALALAEYSMKEIVDVVIASVESLAAEKGLALAVDVPADLPTGHGDQRRLTQVLLNLVGNAIKFTEEGGIGIQAMVTDGAFQVTVVDTGPGIAPADQERIFEEFQQADTSTTRPKGGTGLGLAIARRIMAMHGGRIWVESAVGEGSKFRFTLPVRVDQQVALGAGPRA
jgi:GAF domain-containing protein